MKTRRGVGNAKADIRVKSELIMDFSEHENNKCLAAGFPVGEEVTLYLITGVRESEVCRGNECRRYLWAVVSTKKLVATDGTISFEAPDDSIVILEWSRGIATFRSRPTYRKRIEVGNAVLEVENLEPALVKVKRVGGDGILGLAPENYEELERDYLARGYSFSRSKRNLNLLGLYVIWLEELEEDVAREEAMLMEEMAALEEGEEAEQEMREMLEEIRRIFGQFGIEPEL